jgi:hypothetical protein
MKRFLQILGVFLLLLLSALILIPIVFKDEIIARAKTEINKQLEAEVDFKDIDISLFKNFPNFSLDIEAFTVDGKGTFEGRRLASIGNFNVELNLFSVMAGDKFEVEGIHINDADFYVLIDAEGNANYDIMKATDSTEVESPSDTASGFTLTLKEYAFNNVNLVYDDQQGAMKAIIKGLNHQGNGDFTEAIVNLNTHTDIEALTVGMEGIDYLYRTEVFADINLSFDQPNFKLTLMDNTIGLNELRTKVQGYVALPTDDIEMDLKFSAPQSEFKSVLSLVPAIFLEGFETIKTTGTFSLDGMVKGIFNGEKEVYPSFDINFLVNDGTFRYPDLPAGVEGINVEAHISNPSNTLDATVINIPKANALVANSPFSARMLLKTPMSDPQFDVEVHTNMNLANLKKVVPANNFDYSGTLKGDVAMAGRMSDIDKENYEAVNISGAASAQNIVLKSDSLPFPIEVRSAQMDFTPQKVEIPNLNMKVGRSDFAANGSINNLLKYVLQDSTLEANFNLNSSLIDVNELFAAVPSGGSETATPDTSSPMEVVRLPENINFSLLSKVDKLLYDNLEITALQGEVLLQRGVARLRDLSMSLLGGQIAMDGTYNSVPAAPEADMNFKLSNFGFKETYNAFVTFEKLAPIMNTASGTFSTGFTFKTSLNPDMSPDLSSLVADGALQTAGLEVAPKSLSKLADILKNPSLAKLDIGKVDLSFEIKDGRVEVAPFNFKAGNIPVEVKGSNGLDQTLDYTMDLKLPVSGIGANNLLSNVGVAQGGKVDVRVLIGGTVKNPKVSTSLGNLVNNALDNLKNQAQAKLDEVKNEAIDKANEEAQKLIDAAEAKGDALIAEAEKQAANIKAEAKTAADKIRSEGEAQATKLENEAKGNILKEQGARIAAKKIRDEARDKAAKLEAEAAKRADALVAKAKAEKEKLVEEAREKGKINK